MESGKLRLLERRFLAERKGVDPVSIAFARHQLARREASESLPIECLTAISQAEAVLR